jgi:hypothetical protein
MPTHEFFIFNSKFSYFFLIYIYIYTGCHRRNGQDFGRVFLRSNYTDKTQNTYIQSSMVTEILAREECGIPWCLRTVLCPWRHTRHTTGMDPVYFSWIPTLSRAAANSDLGYGSDVAAYSVWKSVDNCDTCASVFVVLFNGFMSLTSYFDIMYRY